MLFENRKDLIEKLDKLLDGDSNAFDNFLQVIEKGLEQS